MPGYGIGRTVPHTFDHAVERVTEELKKEGFGVLTTIDVRETMKKKLDVDYPKYLILGACNPPLAHRALQADDQIGLLLPCNVVIQEKDGRTRVAAFDPMVMGSLVDAPAIGQIASEVRSRLERVIAGV